MRFYERLGLSTDASESEIKRAYRLLAKRFHPDSGSPGDVARFHEIQEAYDTLSDPERRRDYDTRGSTGSAGVPVSWGGGFEEPIPSWASFREVPLSVRAEPPVHLDIVLSTAEARRGGDVELEVPREAGCGSCGGGGLDFFGWCASCGGSGVVRGHERLRFRVPAGVESGVSATARTSDGNVVRARIRVVHGPGGERTGRRP
jgi:molecular chaperone DnaJ